MIHATIGKGALVQYEEYCMIPKNTKILGRIHVGAYTYFGEGCILGAFKIGRFCSVAPNVTIGLGEHEICYASTHPFFFGSKLGFKIPDGIGVDRDYSKQKFQPPIIGNDVWIGAKVVICRGVKIGDGSVIAAGAVVTSDVEPYSIVGGVPAKHIKYRFNEDVIKRLIDLQWWDLDLNNFVGVDSSDINKFLDELKLKNLNKASYKKINFPAKE